MRFGRALSRLSLFVVPVTMAGALLAPAPVRAAAAPTLSIVTPTQGTTLSGLSSVKVHATTDSAGTDVAGSAVLYVDGLVAGGANGCFPASHDCTFYFLFDWSGYTGNHTEQVKGTTANGVAVSSAVVTVKAVSPPPHAGITSPSEGDTVEAGDVSVTTVGIIDPSQDEDFPTSMQLFVDGLPASFSYCMLRPLCDISLTWDASSAAVGSHTLQVLFTTSLGKTAHSPLVHLTVAAPPVFAAPTVHIDSPADGTTVTGLHGAQVTATTDPDGDDRPASTRLYLDGVLDSTATCATSASTCAMNHLYDVSGLVGTHTLQAQMTTRNGVTVSSQTVTITAVSPPPTVVVTTPTAGATVSGGHVTVAAEGTIDPQQTFDFPLTITLAVDGATVDSRACGTASRTTCSAALDWSTGTAVAGPHSLVVTVITTHGRVGASPALVVNLAQVQPQPILAALALSAQAPYHRGAVGTVYGSLTQQSNGAALVGAAVAVTFTASTGAPVTVSATTDSLGHFAAVDPLRLSSNTAVAATVGPEYGSASAAQTLRVLVRITCSMPMAVVHGGQVTVKCAVPGLGYHSRVALHYAGPTSHGIVYGKVVRGVVSFRFAAPKAQRLAVWATTSTTRSFTASSSARSWLRVR